ncbi:MAG: hypothetical protein M1829_002471 [Trizodia sp. TS-e1964]|nr:MAG: hypothetical protein M1829_002471 [Trizodia sp. TS-e1964]
MAFTPSNSKVHSANLKLTPSNSPYCRATSSKSPIKTSRGTNSQELCLSLKQVIGTTTSSTCAFDALSRRRVFAYTAGAAAVVVELDENLQTSQRFFRARPTALPLYASISPFTPTAPSNGPYETRNRTVASLRESGVGMSPSNAGSPGGDWGDSPGSKTWTARERIKAATCLSFSPDGRHLAVGETGYNPRVLIFSMAKDALPDIPMAILAEHTFGVRCVAFSSDSRYLASLGSINDGFLYIWVINQRTGAARIHSSNKCTNSIRDIAWMGNNLVTVGVRHVKVWRVAEESRPASPTKRFVADGAAQSPSVSSSGKTLTGRNCLLGSLVEATFTCISRISDEKAIACTEKGEICLIDDSDGAQRLSKVGIASFGVSCLTVDLDAGFAWIGGKNGNIKTIHLSNLIPSISPPQSPSLLSPSLASPSGSGLCQLVAMASIAGRLVTVDSGRYIKALNFAASSYSPLMDSIALELPAHHDAVLGVKLLPQPNKLEATFFTWAAGGSVLFWDLQGRIKGDIRVELEQLSNGDDNSLNELKVMQASPQADFFVSGDKYGVLRVIDLHSRKSSFEIRAHASEVMDAAIHKTDKIAIIASCSRDRTVQLFRKQEENWILVQTLDDHAGSVSRVLFLDEGNKLLSCSVDRTIVIRELASKEVGEDVLVVYRQVRVLTLKSTPISIAAPSAKENCLFASTIDRQICKFDIQSGRLVHTFRASDPESNDAVVMDALVLGQERTNSEKPQIMVGVSSTDKSIRVYDHQGGVLIDREYGHCEGVSDVSLLETEQADIDAAEDPAKTTLISTGTDGTIFIWEFSRKQPLPEPTSDSADSPVDPHPVREITAARTPLRRIISRSELAHFGRTPPATTPTSTAARASPPRLLKKKTSKYSLAPSTKTQAPPIPNLMNSGHNMTPKSSSPTATRGDGLLSATARKLSSTNTSRSRASSPPSPKSNGSHTHYISQPKRTPLSIRSRTKSTGTLAAQENLSLSTSSETLCRALRAYRKKLSASPSGETLNADVIADLERELSLTGKAISDKAKGHNTVSEGMLAKLLDQYSERLVEMVDEKIAWRTKAKESVQSMIVGPPVSSPQSSSDGVGVDTENEKTSESAVSLLSSLGADAGTATAKGEKVGR